jgi:hypothetical protein
MQSHLPGGKSSVTGRRGWLVWKDVQDNARAPSLAVMTQPALH